MAQKTDMSGACTTIQWYLVALLVQTLIFMLIIFILEDGQLIGCISRILSALRSVFNSKQAGDHQKLDNDVIAERDYVLSCQAKEKKPVGNADNDPVSNANDDPVQLIGLTKKFGAFTAVNNMNLHLNSSECFGLLGINGAGKTTTFNMLTGSVSATSGNALIKGHDITGFICARTQASKHIGYCPQFDALHPLLTTREMLVMFARLRGVLAKEKEAVVQDVINRLELNEYADKFSSTCSGGMKRKVATGIAIIGDPSVVFFDEPSAGMDPKARQCLWAAIKDIVTDGRTAVLTTHSMEEVEALCQRVTIMDSGQMMCLGSIQHLKDKFCAGYAIILKLKTVDDEEKIHKIMIENFPGSTIYCNDIVMRIAVPAEIPVVKIVQLLHKMIGKVEEFSLSQSSLDTVFIDFARAAEKRQMPKIDV